MCLREQVNPTELSESERAAAQISRLPGSLDDAIRAWDAAAASGDDVVRAFHARASELLGAPLVQALRAVRAAEAQHGPVPMKELIFRY